jgi:hypothetical protein
MCLNTYKYSLILASKLWRAMRRRHYAFLSQSREPTAHLRTLLSVWSDGRALLPDLLVAIDATSCTNTSSGLDL